MAVAFDEMNGTDGALRPAYGELSRWLGEVPPDVLDYRRREAEVLFRRIGITFAVLWRGGCAGAAHSVRRAAAHSCRRRMGPVCAPGSSNASRRSITTSTTFITGARFLKAGVVPEDLVFQNPVFRPEMNGQKVPHDIYVHIGGIDIVRSIPRRSTWIEDNTDAPICT